MVEIGPLTRKLDFCGSESHFKKQNTFLTKKGNCYLVKVNRQKTPTTSEKYI